MREGRGERGRGERTSHTLGRPREAPRDAFMSETPERADARSSTAENARSGQLPASSQPLPAVSSVSGSGRGLHGPAWINSRGFTRTAQREWRDREPRGIRSECVRFSPRRHVFPDLPHAGKRFTLTRISPHFCHSNRALKNFPRISPVKPFRPRALNLVRKAACGRSSGLIALFFRA